MTTGEPVCNAPSFRLEAKFQRVCALCGGGGPFQAHHVLREQDLARLGIKGKFIYDTRNALRLCLKRNCHSRHHSGIETVPTKKLTDENIAYCAEKLGPSGAVDYLVRAYDDSDPDPRLEVLSATSA